MKTHVRKSSSESGKGNSFKCDFCSGEFKQIYDLKNHLLWHAQSAENDKEKGPYFCQACSKSFLVQDKLLDHIKHHHKLLKSNRRSTITSMQSAKIPKETLSHESEKKYLWNLIPKKRIYSFISRNLSNVQRFQTSGARRKISNFQILTI